ncbi:alpha/beta-hydrolase [Eremomyces bilateralis CBS 781.70]|uniref:Alpha/beta-hydrolase n=1 Tax=Eremomyces bilateralis CBS 781.70 TaxID=1392243 RepID=A0A6G1G9C9_9PEZI|nr:alpha/beta-hydrolase [Eremomyces bilateralis CBS 781.70]KAF1814687.1 alpha/beta-hydrolase [Eremomyces bilateralis CBS 781.70]
MTRPRWILHLQASFFRSLMSIGMFLHRRASPSPPSPTFTRSLNTTVSPHPGRVKLHFYAPKGYDAHIKPHQRRRRSVVKRHLYPVVVNFHGGGFTLGHPTDDARWAAYVMSRVGAVVVSVDYRLAPKCPFPTAVEDGVDAMLWLADHATELDLDIDRMAISGFSSGGNMCFTVPLMLQECLLYRAVSRRTAALSTLELENGENVKVVDTIDAPTDTENSIVDPPTNTTTSMLNPPTNPSPSTSTSSIAKDPTKIIITSPLELNIRGVVAFYPPVDYTQSRAARRATCIRHDQHLPALFTNLFDRSYLYPPTLNKANAYLSPARASDDMLAALPEEIVIVAAEWDMLVKETEKFRDRLAGEGGLGKKVKYWCVPGVPHAWDKAPNPFRETPGLAEWYGRSCDELKRILE